MTGHLLLCNPKRVAFSKILNFQEGAPKLPSGPEPTAPIEVEYPSSDELHPVANADEQMQEALRAMADSDWQVATPGLVLLRQLTIHHSEKVWKNM